MFNQDQITEENLSSMNRPLDATDLRLLAALREDPRAAHSTLARRAGISRGTAYSRLDRLEDEGVLIGFGPEVDATSAGLDVLAFATLDILQGSYDETTAALAAIVEITEIHTVTGRGDLVCRIVTRSNNHLHDVLMQITNVPTVSRSETQLALSTVHQRSIVDVLVAASSDAAP